MAEAYVRASLRFVSAIYEWVKLCLVMWNILQFFPCVRSEFCGNVAENMGHAPWISNKPDMRFRNSFPFPKNAKFAPIFSPRLTFLPGAQFSPDTFSAACFLIKKNCHRTANVPTQNIVILAPFLRSDFCFDRWRHTQQVAYDNLWTLS